MRMPRGVGSARTAAAVIRTRLPAWLPTPDRWAGRAGSPAAVRCWCPAAGARDAAGGAWLRWRPPGPPPSAGAAPGGRTGHGLAPAAAAAAADPAPGREPRRRRRQRREGGEAQLVQMRSTQSLEGSRLQTWAGEVGGEAKRLGLEKQQGMNVRALPPPRQHCPLTSRVGVRNGERAGAELLSREEMSWGGSISTLCRLRLSA